MSKTKSMVSMDFCGVIYECKVAGNYKTGEFTLLPITVNHILELKTVLLDTWRNAGSQKDMFVNLHVVGSNGAYGVLVYGVEFINNTPELNYEGISRTPGRNIDELSTIPPDVSETLAILFKQKFDLLTMQVN